jgi:hypothetical protein
MSTTTDPLPCQNINTVLNDIQQKLQKLDTLDSISERLRNIEGGEDEFNIVVLCSIKPHVDLVQVQ